MNIPLFIDNFYEIELAIFKYLTRYIECNYIDFYAKAGYNNLFWIDGISLYNGVAVNFSIEQNTDTVPIVIKRDQLIVSWEEIDRLQKGDVDETE